MPKVSSPIYDIYFVISWPNTIEINFYTLCGASRPTKSALGCPHGLHRYDDDYIFQQPHSRPPGSLFASEKPTYIDWCF